MSQQVVIAKTLQGLLLLASATAAWGEPGGVPAQIESLRASVATIQAQAAASQGQVSALQQSLAGVTASNTTLQNRVTTLQSSVTTLQTTNGALQSQVAALQSASAAVGVTRVSRGSVLFNGSVVSGSGFVVFPDMTSGKFIIAYTTPRFTETPSCVVSADHYQQPADRNDWYCMLMGADVAGLTVQCYAPVGLVYTGNFITDVRSAPTTQNFQFICAQ